MNIFVFKSINLIMRHFQEHLTLPVSVPKTKPFSIGFVNSIGNGFGEINSVGSAHRYKYLMNHGKLEVGCENKKMIKKYIKVLRCRGAASGSRHRRGASQARWVDSPDVGLSERAPRCL